MKNFYLSERNMYGSSRVGLETVNQIVASTTPANVNINSENTNSIIVQKIGDKRFELSNHLGNVLEVISDKKLSVETSTGSGVIGYYSADVISYSDYDPFGMQLPGRNGNSADYEYGFNGMRKDNEIKGDNNSYDFGARIYDPRIWRWLSGDDKEMEYTDLSPYAAFNNRPIYFVDPDGKVLRDPNRNIIVTGAHSMSSTRSGWIYNEDGTKTFYEYQVYSIEGYAYMDEGEKFPISITIGQSPVTLTTMTQQDDKVIKVETADEVPGKQLDETSNCHGHARLGVGVVSDGRDGLYKAKDGGGYSNELLDGYEKTSLENADIIVVWKKSLGWEGVHTFVKTSEDTCSAKDRNGAVIDGVSFEMARGKYTGKDFAYTAYKKTTSDKQIVVTPATGTYDSTNVGGTDKAAKYSDLNIEGVTCTDESAVQSALQNGQ